MAPLALSVNYIIALMIPMIMMASAMVQVLSPGEPMPVLKGEFLTGRPAVLPGVASGRVALLALGFTYDSRFAVEAWVGRFRKDFGDNPQVTFYEVPLIGGAASRPARHGAMAAQRRVR